MTDVIVFEYNWTQLGIKQHNCNIQNMHKYFTFIEDYVGMYIHVPTCM
jgi:hypothetical protein